MSVLSCSSNHLIDKLRTIRPFTESQLLTLYNNNQLDSNKQFVEQFVEQNLRNDSNKLYDLLVRVEKCRERHNETNNRVSDLKSSSESLQEKVWQLSAKSIVRPNRCSDGRTVEAVHKYNESILNKENIKKLDKTLLRLKECVSNDNCINYYLSQFVRLEIENFMINIINENDLSLKSKQFRTAISALFAYQRRCLLMRDKELIKITLNWLLNLSAQFLSVATLDDHLFLLNHVLRCAAGSSVWSTCLIQCPNPLSVSDLDLGNQYMNHCVSVISTILSPIKMREKFIGISRKEKKNTSSSDETWLLVDTELNGEDVTNSYLQIAESDVIRFLKQVPFDDVLEFAKKNKISNDISNASSYGETTELKMLKLLAFSTKLIQILRQGLHSFNCLRFKELTIYISSMIRRTVLVVSDLWANCKTEFMTEDQAMILRLQVEFDHFMLRSMIAILTTNRQGVWNFLSVFPFDGVSESMMWHILWVVYNNGRDELDELGGLCPYFSVNYWKNKFQEVTVQYLFKEKLNSLTITESENLLSLMHNMAISRSGAEYEYISTLIKEIFEISLQTPPLSENMTEKGKEIVVKLITRHNSLIGVIIRQLLEHDSNNEECVELFCEIPLHLWNPEEEDIYLLSEWLIAYPIEHLMNRIARIIFFRLNWSFDSTNKKLFIELEKHQKLALEVFSSLNNHCILKNQKDFQNSNSKLFGGETLLSLAKSVNSNDFSKWVWNQLIVLKLHSLESTEQNWDFIFNGKSEANQNTVKILELNFDTNLIPICRGLEERNPFAIYLALVMTDFGQKNSIEKCVEALEVLLTNQHNIPTLNVLFCLIPFHLKQYEAIISNSKLVSLLSQLFVDHNKELVAMICHQLSKFSDKQNKLKLLICWTEILFEVIGSILRTHSNSWFSSGQSRLEQIAYIFDKISIFIYLDQILKELYLRYLSEHPYDIQSWKLPTSGWFSSLFNWGTGAAKKCEWITPLHLIHKQNPNNVGLGWLLMESDAIKIDKIWEQIVQEISANSEYNLELVIKTICQNYSHSPLPLSLLPIHSWSTQVVNSGDKPPNDLEPLIWFKFFQLFFTSSDSSRSIGLKFISDEKRKKLIQKLNSLIDFHHKLWLSSDPNDNESNALDDRLTKLYRAYILWLEDSQLHEVFVNTDELPAQYLKDLLKCAIANTDCTEFSNKYINYKRIETEALKFYNLWLELHSTSLLSNRVRDSSDEKIVIRDNELAVKAPEVKQSNLDSFNIDIETINNSSALLLLIQHNVRVVLEEAKFFENLLNKFDDLNRNLMESLPDLYHNIKKEIKLKIPCDKDSYDPNGCTGPALFTIEFIEATLNQHSLKSIERNRIDFENIVEQLVETPSNKVVFASLFIEKSIPLLIKSYDFQNDESQIERSLLGSLLSWLNDTHYMYPPSKQVFTNLLDSFGSISEIRCDQTNQFVLETAINHPNIIEYLAPRLFPSKTSTQCFLDMYRLIQEKLTKTPSQVSFVLLSKFDVSNWFRNASHDQCLTLIQILGSALNSFGNKPKDEFLMVFGLYRKHLQYAIIFQFPQYLSHVFQILLKGMKSLSIGPCLWNDVLLSFGFFINREDMDFPNLYLELKKYSNNQPLFTANELFDILSLLSSNLSEAYHEIPLEFLDHFKLYVQKYLTLLSTLSFCWLNANSRMPPCDILNVWRPFYDNWNVWLFPKRSTRFISSDNFQLVWELFLVNVNYFIECFQGMLSSILSCVWQVVLNYIITTKAIDAKDMVVIETKLKSLNWNRFCPNIIDIKLMYEAVIQDQYSIEPFIAYVFSRIDWRHTLQNQSLTAEQLALIVENMSYTMVSLSSEKCLIEIDLQSIPFHLLTATKVQSISQVIARVIKLKSYFFETNNTSHSFLLSLIKQICLISTIDSDICDRDWLLKHRYYANSVSYLLKDLSSGDNDLVTKYPNEIRKFINQCFEDLKPTFQSDIDSTERIALFSELLKCLNELKHEEILRLVTEQYASGFNFESPQTICDLIQSTCKTVKPIVSFLTLIESFIYNYFNVEGDVSNLIEIFEIPNNSDDFMVACVTRNSCLTLQMYLLSKLITTQDSMRFVSNFMNWCSQLRPNADDESKVLLLWIKVLTISENLVDSEDNSLELMQSIQRFCKNLFDIVEETVYQGFLSFMRTNRKSFSERCTFLILCLSLNGIKHLNECTARSSPLSPELNTLYKSALNKLQSLKKNKSFVELLPLIEDMNSVLDRSQSSIESMQLIRQWLITLYSDSSCLNSLL